MALEDGFHSTKFGEWAQLMKSYEKTSFVRNMVSKGMNSKIGGDDRFRFWFDVWCVLVSLQSLFSGLFLFSLQKDSTTMHIDVLILEHIYVPL